MGLFDSAMFSPSNYNGLLGDLLSRFQFQQPQPSQGFPDSQGSYGGINYPIFGQPQTQELSAQSVQPQVAQAQAQYQPPQEQPMFPQQQGGFGNALQGFIANAHTGPIGALLGGIAGATGMGTGDPTQNTYRALVQAGVPSAVAIAAARNPEILKTIAPQIYQKPELKDTGTNPLTGQKNLQIWDPNKHTLTPPNSGSQTNTDTLFGSQAFYDKISQMRDSGATQDQLLQAIPSSHRGYVAALLKGEALPVNLGRAGPAREGLITLAHTIDPKFDEAVIPQRVAYARSFGSTTPSSAGGQIQASGTVVKHLGDAFSALPAIEAGILGQSDTLNQLNPIKSYIRSQSGDKQYLDAVGKYNTAVKGIAGEMERLLSGGPGAERSKDYWMKQLGLDSPPTQRRAALDEVRSLMFGRLSNVAQQKDRAFGTQTDPYSLLGKDEQKIAREITAGTYSGGQSQQSVTSSPQTAINPRTGERLMLDPKTNQWVPYK